jgi:hypothetical protein
MQCNYPGKKCRKVEVSAIDPSASMQSVENDQLKEIASEVSARLHKVIDQL